MRKPNTKKMQAECDAFNAKNPIGSDVFVKLEAAEKELERERIRLAACGTAALGYFEGCLDEYRSAALDDVLRLRNMLEAAERDAAKWQAYQKRKQEVIAAGMGRKIMRDLESHDALPAFYTAMKEKP